ncbi:hypothetical protein PR202_gb20585 [Eleusine coracana subsp. coracana]|uniref:DUF7769 domain-containing protein n=1 Tax=Eleusine coracana subsp. coracana TaxID=191504 RepID=A0AAV5FB04_ELECO|nr:hypothetical protein PR202_gb20585 [Eleusine coracana subsp. coracana]
MLLARTDPPILHHGVLKEVATMFDMPVRTCQKIWHKGQAGGFDGLKDKRPKNSGRKKIEISPDAIKNVELHQRTTLKDLAGALGVKKSTLHNRFKEGCFRRHSNDIKYTLTDENMKARVKYCLSMLRETSEGEKSFDPMYNIMYIDEKWFYRTRRNQKYYLVNDEQRPRRSVKSKNFIEKVMFLTVITRPRFDSEGKCIFDGKIGIFPFTYVEPAQRNSRNRPRGINCAHTYIYKGFPLWHFIMLTSLYLQEHWLLRQ